MSAFVVASFTQVDMKMNWNRLQIQPLFKVWITDIITKTRSMNPSRDLVGKVKVVACDKAFVVVVSVIPIPYMPIVWQTLSWQTVKTNFKRPQRGLWSETSPFLF